MDIQICEPAFVTAALFLAILIVDLGKQDYKLITGHFLFGIIAVLLMLFLCQRDAKFVAWGVLAIPFILLAFGLIIGAIQAASGTKKEEPTPVKPARPCTSVPCCEDVLHPPPNPTPDVPKPPTPTPKPTPTPPCGPGSSGSTACLNVAALPSA